MLLLGGLLAAAIVVLFFEPGLVGRINEEEQAGETPVQQLTTRFQATLRDQLPEVPDVLGLASPIYDLRLLPDAPVRSN